jgi:hypothetical protein
MAIITRAEWRKIRDRNGVGKGHAKVSIGGALDAYHATKTCDTRLAKLDALAAAYASYSKSLDIKKPGEQQLAREIGGQLLPAVREAQDKYEDYKKIAKDAQNLTVDKLLKSKRMLALYTTYAKKAYTDESLDFIRAVDKKMKKQQIWETFVDSEAPRLINLPGAIRSKLEVFKADEQYDKMNFTEARRSICDMLERDSLPRFVVTKEFKDLISEMAGTD